MINIVFHAFENPGQFEFFLYFWRFIFLILNREK